MQSYSLLYLETALHFPGGTSTHHQERIQLHASGIYYTVNATCRLVNLTTLIPIYIQQDATLHSLLYLETALHVSGGTSTHHQERIQLHLQHLVFVTPLLLPAAIAVPPETCRAVSRYNRLCNFPSCWIYIGIFLRCTHL